MNERKDILTSRAIIKHGLYALIPPEGLVNNVIPGFENCHISILASPKLGASFVDYLVTLYEGGKNKQGFGGDDSVETFVYVLEGELTAFADDEAVHLSAGGYLYCPPHVTMYLENGKKEETKLFLYKQKHRHLEGHTPWVVSGNVHEIEAVAYEGLEYMRLQDLLPTDIAFDMNFHILTFDPAGSHPFIETHVQQHGAYLLSGQGVYNLDNKWVPVKKGDYIFMGPYVQQATYAVGQEKLSYLYSIDCNRDEPLD